MSRYIQTLIIAVFFLGGCSLNQTVTPIGEKAFKDEDYLILLAFEQQKNSQTENTIKTYKTLYDKSGKVIYIVEALKRSLRLNNKKTASLLKEALNSHPKNSELRRMEIVYLGKNKRLEMAKKRVLELLKDDKSAKNLKVAGSVYVQKKSYKLALMYFESAYRVNSDENSLLYIVDLMYNYLNKKDDAIAILETHIRVKSCEINSCFKLIEIYGKQKNIKGVISTYKKLYFRFKNEQYAKKVVELLVYIKDKKGAIEFLSKSGYNQDMLLDLYVSTSDFSNAFILAKKLYKENQKNDYLARAAIYEYELNKKHLNSKILKSIFEKFELVIPKLYNSIYLNYYGYILIDQNIDVKKGISLVKEALLREPKSLFYLDSLAWGYYRLGNCKRAKTIMDRLIKYSKEKELVEHSKIVNSCIKRQEK